MSHLTLEYSGNLRAVGDFPTLCGKLSRCMVGFRADGQTVFPPGGIRVRAIPCDEFSIADGSLPDAAFVHAILKIGAGRSEAAKQSICQDLFATMKQHFATQFASRGLALSLELLEFRESGTLKHNNLHAFFKSSRSD